jgi:hypothetical protein
MIYVDTSVLAAYYCPEILSEQVQQLLSEQVEPVLSWLTQVELSSAVAKKVRSNELNSADGNRILAKFISHLNAGFFRMIAVEEAHWQLAKSWIGLFTTPLRTLDALHLAIASNEELQLVTSDKPLFSAAKALGVNARLLEQ